MTTHLRLRHLMNLKPRVAHGVPAGRLFWKLLAAFWLALLLVGVGVAWVTRWQAEQARERFEQSDRGAQSRFVMQAVAAALEFGGVERVRDRLAERRRPRHMTIYVVDDAGIDLLGRTIDPAEIKRARALARDAGDDAPARFALSPDGRRHLVFVGADSRPWRGRPPRPEPLPAWVPLALGLLASLIFSAVLAWYLTRPVRHLRQAFAALAEGRLDTRVGTSMGGRRDEIADLGRDFDAMAERLQHLLEAQRRLLHDVSHELRSPLARMQAAIGLAQQDAARMPAAVDRVEREAARLDELVGGLLTLSRLRAGAQDAPESDVDICELAAAVVADARFEARVSDRDVTLSGVAELHLRGRAPLLRRAIENVVRNAVRYTVQGSVVTLHVALQGDMAHLTVSDDGPGVPEAELAQLFEPFHRVGDDSTPGFGLGLAIARRAIELHGGHIEARNRASGGLEVHIMLPIRPAVRQPGAGARPSAGGG